MTTEIEREHEVNGLLMSRFSIAVMKLKEPFATDVQKLVLSSTLKSDQSVRGDH